MEEFISVVANICGILGFIISLITVKQVYNVKKEIRNSNNNKVRVSDTEIGGDFIGRDKK